jgi:hypothetical protein
MTLADGTDWPAAAGEADDVAVVVDGDDVSMGCPVAVSIPFSLASCTVI